MDESHDPRKAASNARKHAREFAGFEEIFNGPFMDFEDRTVDYEGEERRVAIGWLRDWFAYLVYTERDGSLRPISLRKAEPHEIEKLRRYLRGQ